MRRRQKVERDTLFVDAAEDALISGQMELPGLDIQHRGTGEVQITDVEVLTEAAASRVGKVPGHYITIEAPKLRNRNQKVQREVREAVASELSALLDLTDDSVILVVGLGNEHATPDALGPRVIQHLLITRHLRPFVPEDMRGNLRPVCGVAPGVLGTTGIETGEIIRGIVEHIDPDVIVAIDALASRSIERMLTTIQIADTGIQPASGVGGKRLGITKEVLGVPVIALGVPTVVHALTMATETIGALSQEFRKKGYYTHLESLSPGEREQLMDEVLGPLFGDLMVTAKEIDVFIDDMSQLMAAGMNATFHPELSADGDLASFLF